MYKNVISFKENKDKSKNNFFFIFEKIRNIGSLLGKWLSEDFFYQYYDFYYTLIFKISILKCSKT